MTVPRILAGLKGSDLGLWISKPTIDVTSASDQQMLLSIALGMLVPIMVGSVTFTQNSTTSQNVSHGLGYRPVVLIQGVQTTPPSIGGGAMDFQVLVTTTQVQFNPLSGTAAATYRYLIFARDADA